MGYLLKEALKTLCGINQWAYAVFWKIGVQNPKLLIWEEYYYGPESCSGLPRISGNENPEVNFQDAQAEDKVHLLVNKMMMDHHVKIVGEGLIGRVAFTGSHQWILSENLYGEAHPPEVLKEMYEQFYAGIQTVAVVPVLPHGVVQFGSYFKILENMGFLNDVVSLVHQLEHVPGVLLSDNHSAKGLSPQISLQESRGCLNPGDMSLESDTMKTSPVITDCFGFVENSFPNPFFEGQPSYSSTGIIHNDVSDVKPYCLSEAMITPAIKSEFSSSNPETWINQLSSPFDLKPVTDLPSTSQDSRHNGKNLNMAELFHGFMEDDSINQTFESQLNNTVFDDAKAQTRSGDNIFDILGGGCNNFTSHESAYDWDTTSFQSKTSPSSTDVIHSTTVDKLDSGIFSSICSDQLLDAVVSKAHPCPKEDTFSCKTTITNLSSCSSAAKVPLPYGRFRHTSGNFSGIPEYLAKAGAFSSSSLCTASSNDVGMVCSSIYDSSAQKGKDVKQTISVSTGYSKKPPEPNKSGTRKRLKPGENPRPRPKDRQMIQDRVKELREIVPNGAKCSIDALLERTIKHMLFLQGITKHADKLKQTVESKIISEDGGLLFKEKFEGGATWAYEIGSRSMICPIIVEDLNQPRQMLIEILCEERGSFLEIADIIRGLGLTILKGTMRTRNNKIWSRFVVEANRDVTRMEIFISLVRLLEQSTKKGDTNENMTMIPQFHRAAASIIPATGDLRNLQ